MNHPYNGVFARKILYENEISKILGNEEKVRSMHENIKKGDMYIVKNVLPKKKVLEIHKYLVQIGRNSLPNYEKIEIGCPNFHRINNLDPRAYVKGCFHQFVFFPWNQDVFDFFRLFKEIFQLKNLLSNLPRDKFLGVEPEDGCTSRLAFQFYPKGAGQLNKHSDPIDYHQLTVPVMVMSEKGVDFQEGGAFVENEAGEKIDLEKTVECGDVIYFNAQIAHGVDKIDPGAESNWLSFEGRWMALFAVNKLSDNKDIPDAVDLEHVTN